MGVLLESIQSPADVKRLNYAQLAELAEQPPPDVVCLVVVDKLDKKASEAPWVRAVEKHGIWVPVWPVGTAALPAWLRARAKQLHVEIEPAAAQLIVDRVEGNLGPDPRAAIRLHAQHWRAHR